MNQLARDALVESLLQIARGDHAGAVSSCHAASGADPEARLPKTLARYLDLSESGSSGDVVYREPAAFEAFIDGGDNPALYEATIHALRQLDPNPSSVLDIGCGDGRVTGAVIGPDTDRVHLVDPSAAMLAEARIAVESVDGAGRQVSTTNAGIEALVLRQDRDHWQRAQATFALHAVQPQQRRSTLRWLVDRVETVALVEFDVPGFADRSKDHARYVVERYERGLAEYDAREPVTTGFLLPVLVGQFDPAATRHTWEQPIRRWCADLEAAGFDKVANRRIHDYWWAPAHLITARGTA